MELGWMGGSMGGFCQGFKAMTSLKCDWSDAVTVGEPSRMMSVLSIFSLQSVEQTVEEWGGGAKLTGNSFTQQQVCVLQSCTEEETESFIIFIIFFTFVLSATNVVCWCVCVCAYVCVTVPVCVSLYVCVCVALSVGVCVLWYFFFLPGSGSNSSHSSLICFYSKPPLLSLSPFLLYYSLPFFPTHFLSFLLFIVSLISFLYFLYYFFYFSFFPPFSSCYFVFLLTSSSSLSHPHPLFDFVTISSLLPSFPFTSPLLSTPFFHIFLPSFPPPPSPLHQLLLLIGIEVEHCIVGSWRWGVVVNFLVSGNRSSPVHCGKEAMVLRGGGHVQFCVCCL